MWSSLLPCPANSAAYSAAYAAYFAANSAYSAANSAMKIKILNYGLSLLQGDKE